MRPKWLACATVTALAALPALAQTDTNVVVTTTDTTTTVTGSQLTTVDQTQVRGYMDDLRGFLTRIQENNRLAFSTSDAVHMDAYRRTNEVLLDNASGLAMSASNALGPATRIPAGLGATRDYIEMVVNHLHHARMMQDYSSPIDQAAEALDNAYEAMNRSSMAMSGSNMAGMGTRGTVTTETETSGTTTTAPTDMSGTTTTTETTTTESSTETTTQPDTMTPTDTTTPSTTTESSTESTTESMSSTETTTPDTTVTEDTTVTAPADQDDMVGPSK